MGEWEVDKGRKVCEWEELVCVHEAIEDITLMFFVLVEDVANQILSYAVNRVEEKYRVIKKKKNNGNALTVHNKQRLVAVGSFR